MTQANAGAGLDQRLSSAFLEEERRGIAWSMRGRLVSIALIAVWVSIDNRFPDAYYVLALLAGFAGIGVLFLWLGRSEHYASWMKYVFIALDASLLAFTLLVPSPFRDFDYDIQIQLRFNNYPYFFVILVGIAAFTYSPRFVVWAGLACAAAWTIGVSFIIFKADTLTSADITQDAKPTEILTLFLDPKFVFVNLRITEILATLIVAGILAAAAWRARRLVVGQTEAERQRTNLARYLSPNMLDQLSNVDEPFGGVHEQHVAVLFVDIVGFTALSAEKRPDEVIALLRDFHARMAQTVFAFDGTLDKFIGDEVMATFGTPSARNDDPLRALRCARAMAETVADWNAERRQAAKDPVFVGIGLHYGPVVTGDIGDRSRLEFAVVGDTVNVASRLERLTRDLEAELVASDAVVAAAGLDDADTLLRGMHRREGVSLRGREQHVVDVWVASSESRVGRPEQNRPEPRSL